jgi:hypothetical protein
MINAYTILGGHPEGKRLLGRAVRRWENNIKVYVTQIWCDDVDCIHLLQNRAK